MSSERTKNKRLTLLATVLLSTLRPRQTCRHFSSNILKSIFFNEKVSWKIVSMKISLQFLPKGPVNKKPALVPVGNCLNQWLPSLLTHICITRSQWVKIYVRKIPNLCIVINTMYTQLNLTCCNPEYPVSRCPLDVHVWCPPHLLYSPIGWRRLAKTRRKMTSHSGGKYLYMVTLPF